MDLQGYRDRYGQELFAVEDRWYRVYVDDDDVSIGRAQTTYIPATTPSEKAARREFLREQQTQAIGRTSIQVYKMGDPSTKTPCFTRDGGKVLAKLPTIQPYVRDNAFIENYLEEVFVYKTHIDFIRDYMACYTCTNYQRLPFIVLTGKRGTGKTTFVELVGSIYPSLYQKYTSAKFNISTKYVNAKLLHIDEMLQRDDEFFTRIKRITGSDKLLVTDKYGFPLYSIKNNTNVIVDTNEHRPFVLKEEDLPQYRHENGLFVKKVARDPKRPMNPFLLQELRDRLGWYVQDVLVPRFKFMEDTNHFAANRYLLRVPMTAAGNKLVSLSIEHRENKKQG